jgi:photosystem II stability/assembly factor-like uncharacterized protein
MRKFLLFSLLLFNFFVTNAQWSKCTLPAGATPFSLGTHADTIYLGTISTGVYRSTNAGQSWTEVNTGIVNKQIWSIYTFGNTIFVGAASGNVYRSTNGGDNWTLANSGISSTTIIKNFASFNGKLFAASTNKGIYMSSDNGNTWVQHNTGIGGLVASALLVADGDLYASVMQYVYKYDSVNQSWVKKSTGIPNNTVTCLTYLKDNSQNLKLFACSVNSKDVERSDDKAENWVTANTGLPSVGVWSLFAVGTSVFAGNDYGVYQTTDFGNNWTDVSLGFPFASPASFISASTTDLYVLQGAALWKRALSALGITATGFAGATPRAETINLFANSATGFIRIDTPEPIQKTEIYSLQGALLCQSVSGNREIDVRGLPKGIYVARIQSAGSWIVGKFIKK